MMKLCLSQCGLDAAFCTTVHAILTLHVPADLGTDLNCGKAFGVEMRNLARMRWATQLGAEQCKPSKLNKLWGGRVTRSG